MKILGTLNNSNRLNGSEAILSSAITAGANYSIKNNGPYDAITCVSFATGNSYEYWVIVQALSDLGQGNLASQVNDPWQRNNLETPINTSGSGAGIDPTGINQENVQGAQSTLKNIAMLLDPGTILAEAQSYARSMNSQPAVIITALSQAPTTSPVAAPASPNPISQTPVAPAPPPPVGAPGGLILKTTTTPTTTTVTDVPTHIFVTNPNTGVTTVVPATHKSTGLSSNMMMWGLAAAAAYFLLKK